MSETQLERSVLEAKEREELFAIADALGSKPGARAKKADLVTQILRATGIEAAPDGEITEKPRRTRARKAVATPDVDALPDRGGTDAAKSYARPEAPVVAVDESRGDVGGNRGETSRGADRPTEETTGNQDGHDEPSGAGSIAPRRAAGRGAAGRGNAGREWRSRMRGCRRPRNSAKPQRSAAAPVINGSGRSGGRSEQSGDISSAGPSIAPAAPPATEATEQVEAGSPGGVRWGRSRVRHGELTCRAVPRSTEGPQPVPSTTNLATDATGAGGAGIVSNDRNAICPGRQQRASSPATRSR